jgi:hypothetical protein
MITGDMGDKLNNYFTSSIGTYAFVGCSSLTSLDLSGLATSLTSITSYAFSDCAAITTIDLSNTKVSSISSRAFQNCAGLTTLKLPPAMFAEENSASIGTYAFRNCARLSNIYIPYDAAKLPNTYNSNAFNNCSTSGTI